MQYTFLAKGHSNITSRHKTTFEVTRDTQMGKTADCIVGISSEASPDNLPVGLREAIRNEKQIIRVLLETENSTDEIIGYGHHSLTLNHPSDMVCRKSNYICSRTLMILADKAASDLKKELVTDLKAEKPLKVTIIVKTNSQKKKS
jgi:uncharacterized protein